LTHAHEATTNATEDVPSDAPTTPCVEQELMSRTDLVPNWAITAQLNDPANTTFVKGNYNYVSGAAIGNFRINFTQSVDTDVCIMFFIILLYIDLYVLMKCDIIIIYYVLYFFRCWIPNCYCRHYVYFLNLANETFLLIMYALHSQLSFL